MIARLGFGETRQRRSSRAVALCGAWENGYGESLRESFMARMMTLAIIAIVTTFSVSGWAQDNQDLATENAQLKGRVEKLEEQVQGLTTGTAGQGQSSETEVTKNPIWSSLDIQFYGFLKVDAAYDNSRTTPGNFVLFVDNDQATANSHDDEFNLTANQTQLGFLINGPKDSVMQTSGRVEVDFYGNFAAENQAKMQLRHAYVQMEWPDKDLTLLAGQTWDVVSPLNPSTINYSVLWDSGNIGYRRPQIRLTKDHQLNDEVSLKFTGALSRTIGRIDAVGSESGEDSGLPTIQGRVGVTFPWLVAGDTTIGLSGHRGKEEYDTSTTKSVDHDTWSINIDLVQPIRSWVTLKAEAFTGENLNSYLGGIGQGVDNGTRNKEISSRGWLGRCLLRTMG